MKKKTPKILVTDDLNPLLNDHSRTQALKTIAAYFADRLKTGVDVLHVENLAVDAITENHFRPMLEEYIEDVKTRFHEMNRSKSKNSRAFFMTGDPVEKIISFSGKSGHYEMVMVGTHGHTGLGRMILGSVAEEVVRRSKIPVLALGPAAQERVGSLFKQKPSVISVATSLTENSKKAEMYAFSLAQRLKAKLVFIHNLKGDLHPLMQTALATSRGERELSDLMDKIEKTALKALETLCKQGLKKGVDCSYVLDRKLRPANQTVLESSKNENADLLIMGTQGRTWLMGTVLGRTARDVILRSPIPVITLRSNRT